MTFTLQLLHLSDAEAGLLASHTAPYLAALVDAFDDDYGNSLILSGGDNFLPGPFLNAGTDPSLNAIIGATAAARLVIEQATDVIAGEVYDGDAGTDTLLYRRASSSVDLSQVILREIEDLSGFAQSAPRP